MRVAIRQECQECRQFPHVMQLYSNVLECDHEMNLKQITARKLKCYMWDGWTFYILFILKLPAASIIFWYHEKKHPLMYQKGAYGHGVPHHPAIVFMCVLVICFHRNACILIDVCDVKQSHIMFVGYIYIGLIVYMYVCIYICIYTHCITIHPRTVAHISTISTISTISSLSPLSPFNYASLVAYPSNLPILPSWLIIRII